jgi:hypothetical protein
LVEQVSLYKRTSLAWCEDNEVLYRLGLASEAHDAAAFLFLLNERDSEKRRAGKGGFDNAQEAQTLTFQSRSKCYSPPEHLK